MNMSRPERDLGRKAIETTPLRRPIRVRPSRRSPERDLGRKAIETLHDDVAEKPETEPHVPKETLAERLLRPRPWRHARRRFPGAVPKETLAERLLRPPGRARRTELWRRGVPKETLAERLLRPILADEDSDGLVGALSRKRPWPKGY